MKLNRKGFTLIELLATIVIVGLVVVFSVFGIMKVLDDSNEKTSIISEKSIKEAARIYSSEASSSAWKKTSEYDAFCVTIGELKNKGLLDKDASISVEGVDNSTFVMVQRNNVTMAVEKEIITKSGDSNHSICTNEVIIENDIKKNPSISDYISYTDRIEISFNPGESLSGIRSYSCLYGTSSSDIDREGVISGNKCLINGVNENSTYYVHIYMDTNAGSSVLAVHDGNEEKKYNTKDFTAPSFNQSLNNVSIYYNDSYVIDPSYYFYSTSSGTSDDNLELCNLEHDKFICSGTTKEIKANTWYKTANSNINIKYPEISKTITLTARIYDASNNYKEVSKDFKINKYTVKFYKNTAGSIDGSTSNYIERSCISAGNDKCSVTSPSITPNIGYSSVGWNTNSSATTSSWNIGVSKEINTDYSYYAITRINKVTIQYSPNGGSVKDTTTWTDGTVYDWYVDNGLIGRNGGLLTHVINYGSKLSDTYGLNDYNNKNSLYVTKTGYSAVSDAEWICLSGCTTDNKVFDQTIPYAASQFCDASYGDCTVTLGVNWTPKIYNINLNNQSATTAGTTVIYEKYETGIYLDSGFSNKMSTNANKITVPKKTGYTFGGYYTDANGSGTQMISSSGYITSNFTTTKYTSNTILYAKWTKNTVNIRYNTNGGSITTSNSAGKWSTDTTGLIYLNNSVNVTSLEYGASLGSDGLNNWNNSNYLNVYKDYYSAVSGAEWVCLSGCSTSGATYSHAKVYNASDFCDASSSSCTVTLGVNWVLSSVKSTIKAWKSSEGSSVSSGVAANSWISYKFYGYPSDKISKIQYCVDFDNTCIPNTTYTGDNYISQNSYIRYRAVSTTGIVESTNSFYGLIATYTVSYNANGGSGAPGSQTKHYGRSLTLSSTVPTRSGYTFLGWSTNSAATSATYGKGGTYTANEGATLYAVWQRNDYTITYNLNGGSGSFSAQTNNVGSNTTIHSNRPTRVGYDFGGWNTNINGSGSTYQPGSTYSGNSSITLYAMWNNHTHVWDAIGNILRGANDNFTCGFYHTEGYARYCSTCGMSFSYARANGIASGGALSCPCNHGAPVWFNDSGLSWTDVTNRVGTTGGQSLLSRLSSAPSALCSEQHITGSRNFIINGFRVDSNGITVTFTKKNGYTRFCLNFYTAGGVKLGTECFCDNSGSSTVSKTSKTSFYNDLNQYRSITVTSESRYLC